jgi:hypothetical protein
MITNVICEILIKSNDMQILQRGTSFLRFYIPMCKDTILNKYVIYLYQQTTKPIT